MVAIEATSSEPRVVVTSAFRVGTGGGSPRSRASAVSTAANEPATNASPYGPGLPTWAAARAAQKPARYTPSVPRSTPVRVKAPVAAERAARQVLGTVRTHAEKQRDHEHDIATKSRPSSGPKAPDPTRRSASNPPPMSAQRATTGPSPSSGAPAGDGAAELLLERQEDARRHHEQQRPEAGERGIALWRSAWPAMARNTYVHTPLSNSSTPTLIAPAGSGFRASQALQRPHEQA